MAAAPGTLHHVELYVSNLAASRAFWEWLLGELGYELFQEWPQGCSFRLDATYIVLVQTEAGFLAPPYHRKRVGLNHLAFHARDRAQVDALAVELQRRGYTLLYPDRHPRAEYGQDGYVLFCEDPDRIKVEVVAPLDH